MAFEKSVALLLAVFFLIAASTCSAATAPRRALQFGGITVTPEEIASPVVPGGSATVDTDEGVPVVPPGLVIINPGEGEDDDDDDKSEEEDEDIMGLTWVVSEAPEIPQRPNWPPVVFHGREMASITAINVWADDEGNYANIAFSGTGIGEILFTRPEDDFERRQISLMDNGSKVWAIHPNGKVAYIVNRDGNKIQRINLDFSSWGNSYTPKDDEVHIDLGDIEQCSRVNEIVVSGENFVFSCYTSSAHTFMFIDWREESSDLSNKVKFSPSIGVPGGLFPMNINGTNFVGAFDNVKKKIFLSEIGAEGVHIPDVSGGGIYEFADIYFNGCTRFGERGVVCALNEGFTMGQDVEVPPFAYMEFDSTGERLKVDDLTKILSIEEPFTPSSPTVVHSRNPRELYFSDSNGLFVLKPKVVSVEK